MCKKAKNSEEARKLQEKYPTSPNGWIQWKGTFVCMDVHCKCGWTSHIDTDFSYHVKCPKCGTMYMCAEYIELIEVEEEPNCLVFPILEE